MKKVIAWVLVCVLALSACGKNAEASWQEQYDLGMRYLSEGKYEEAILAFNAAIEIDPKQPAAYVGLADAYTALGDAEAAADALRRGLEAIGENETLSSRLAELSAQDDAANTPGDSGDTPLNAYGATEFTARETYRAFDSLSAEEQALVEAIANAAIAQDAEALGQIVSQSPVFDSESLNDFQEYSTIWNEYKLHVFFSSTQSTEGELSTCCNVEMRPENGDGYCLDWNTHTIKQRFAHTGNTASVCPCVDWQWNGVMRETITNINRNFSADGFVSELKDYYTTSGMVVNNLRDGTFTEVGTASYGDINNTIEFQEGVMLSINGEPTSEEVSRHIYSVLVGVLAKPSDNPLALDTLYW